MRKKENLNSNLVIVGIIVVLLILFLLVLISNRSNQIGPNSPEQAITINTPDGSVIKLDNSGEIFYKTANGNSYSDLWSRDKTNEFVNYLRSRYFAEFGEIVNVLSEDELINLITSELAGNTTTPTPTGGVSEFFNSPTPTPTPTGSSGGGGGGGSGGNGGGWQSPSWCRVWKLSYCADVITPSPGQTATPTISPTSYTSPLPPDCDHPGNQQTGRTVIGGQLCLPSPIP